MRLWPRLNHWGATPHEIAGPLVGDERVASPDYTSTYAITIHAPPVDVWPWLSQMGYRRGGLYSYDWLDRLFGYLDAASATEVLPEYQSIGVGDIIPLGRGASWPVVEVQREHALVIEPIAGTVTWSFALIPVGAVRTRLVTRVRFRTAGRIRDRLTMAVLGPAAFIMTRRMLLGIRERAEALSAHRTVRDGLAAPPLADENGRITATRADAHSATGATERAHVPTQ